MQILSLKSRPQEKGDKYFQKISEITLVLLLLFRARTEIGNQNSRTFPGVFKDYLHFFQESFFIDSNSPSTAYTQDFCPI